MYFQNTCLLASVVAAATTPFSTQGSRIVGADGSHVNYAGVNWPGAEQTMVPEGLQYLSVEEIVGKIKSLGLNSIRLTYATELVDQIYINDLKDVTIQQAFVDALGQENGTAIFNRVVERNPSFDSNTTRLQVYDAIAAECAKQNIWLHLDNHVSKASWCCSPFDGNAWWNDTYFSPSNWTRGLSYMAQHGKSWPALVSMSLYNELRPHPAVSGSYNWTVWYAHTKQGAAAIHAANPDVLIFLSGLNGDTDLQPVVDGTALAKSAFAPGYQDKLILELHSYAIVFAVADCASYSSDLFRHGYAAIRANATNAFPVVMTEWGFAQDATTWTTDTYATCVQKFLRDSEVLGAGGWMIWVISGSYYVREGKQDADEPWGLLSHDWSDWRSPEFIEGGLKPLVTASLEASGRGSQLQPVASGAARMALSWISGVLGAILVLSGEYLPAHWDDQVPV